MKYFKDSAVVIEQHKLGEADLIITLFTKRRGLVRAVAKGVRRTKSKFGGKLQLFSLVEVQLYQGKSLSTITQVNTVATLGPLLADNYEKYNNACAIAELARRLMGEEYIPNEKLFNLTVRALRTLAAVNSAEEYIFISFLLHALRVSGWLPDLSVCSICGRHSTELVYMNPVTGSVGCSLCMQNSPELITPSFNRLTQSFYKGDWEYLDNFSSSKLLQIRNIWLDYLVKHTNIRLNSVFSAPIISVKSK